MLGRGPDRNLVTPHLGNRHMRLHGVMMHHRKGEHVLEDRVGLGKACIDCTTRVVKMMTDVGASDGTQIGEITKVASRPQGLME